MILLCRLKPSCDEVHVDLRRPDTLGRLFLEGMSHKCVYRLLYRSQLNNALDLAGYWPYIQVGEHAMANPARRTTGGRARAQRLEARVTAEQKTLIERAAALQGRTVTDFVLTSVQDAARRAIEEHRQLQLSVRDSEAFVDALLNPKPINDRLRETIRRYREATGV